MNKRSHRIMWVLNHKTLMPYEAALLEDLGFEVFTPKVLSESPNFRSGAVDWCHDAKLSIPPRVLKRLNAFNFYQTEWPADIVALVNRYFGTAFVIPHASLVPEALDKFEGRIIFRAFGLINEWSYRRALEEMHGRAILAKIYNLGDRFWFGEGYEQLHEDEPDVLSRRALYLPIGLAQSSWRNANRWKGGSKQILFVCPNILTNSYYNGVYRMFKSEFGDLPHVIVGAQSSAVDDPHVLGHVSDESLQELYCDCALLLYTSHEARHVHYSPIEASICGMPIVFFKDCLLARVCDSTVEGSVDSVDQARQVIERLLRGDRDFIDRVCADQHRIADHFANAYCRPVWERSLARCGMLGDQPAEPLVRAWSRELIRVALMPVAHGLAHIPKDGPAVLPPYSELGMPAVDTARDSWEDGIDFRQREYPSFVYSVSGLSFPEPWGRWSTGRTIDIVFWLRDETEFRLILVGGAYGKNIGAAVKVRIGGSVRTLKFARPHNDPETVTLEFSQRAPWNAIQLSVPFPTVPPSDNRAIGIGLTHLRIEPLRARANVRETQLMTATGSAHAPR